MKKVIVQLMAIILIVSTLPMQYASAEVTCDGNGFCFEEVVNSQGVVQGVKLRSYNGATTAVDIPNTFNGQPVIEIGDGVFMNKALVRVNIPHTVEKIGMKAFYFSRLKEVTLPNEIKVIGDEAFSGNLLSKIEFPEGLEEINRFAFSLNDLTFIELPKSLSLLGSNAFYDNQLIGLKVNSNLSQSDSINIGPFSSNELRYVEFGPEVNQFSLKFLKSLSNLPYDSKGYWFTDSQFNNVFTGTVPTGVTRIYANSIDNEYSVLYEANGATGGEVPRDVTAFGGGVKAKVLAPKAALTKPNAKFLGWNTKADGSGTFYMPGDELTMPFHFVQLYAHWGDENSAVVTTHLSQDPTHYFAKIGKKITLAEPKAEHDYHFAGWYTDEELSKPFNVKTEVVRGDLALYPKFERNPLIVQFETNGGTPIADKKYNFEAFFNLSDIKTAREGYQFAGWYYDSAFTKKVDERDSVIENYTLYAKWNKNEYFTITFETNGGTSIEPYQVLKGNMLEYTQFVPTKEGYEFLGWYKDETLQIPVSTEDRYISSNRTFYAKWVNKTVPTITFDVDGGEPIEQIKIPYGQALSTAPTAFKQGYQFVGWFYDAQLTDAYQQDRAILEDMTMYAKWTKVEETKGYINGFPDGSFKPNAPVTREQMALMLANILTNYNVPADEHTVFTDTKSSYAKDAINFVSVAGLMTGKTATTFDPQGNMTRSEMATVVSRFVKNGCSQEPNRQECTVADNDWFFSDVSDSFWAKQSINHVANLGTMIGYVDGTFKPNNQITRAESVKVLNGLFNRKELPNDVLPRQFSDTMSHWARQEIEKAATSY